MDHATIRAAQWLTSWGDDRRAVELDSRWRDIIRGVRIFCQGTFLAGLYVFYVQSYRFAAAGGCEGADRGRAISWDMVGGLVAAIIGPQLVIATRDVVSGVPFAGSFLSQAALALIAFFVLTRLRGRQPAASAETSSDDGGRTVLQLLASPKYMLGVAAGVVSYGLV